MAEGWKPPSVDGRSGTPKQPMSRRRKTVLGVVAGLGGLLVVGALVDDDDSSDSAAEGEATTTATATTPEPPSPTATSQATADAPSTTIAPPTTTTTVPAAAWTAVSVADGDTLDVDGPGGRLTVRLIGINAPERGECFGDEAAAALTSLTGGDLTLIPDVSDVDDFGRELRYVETADGRDVGAELVRGGFAISRRYDPDTARNDQYEVLQSEAEAEGAGLWAPDACGPATAEVSIDLEIRYDAAGDDTDNKNDEWVRFTNTSSAPLPLDGWVVADESASHRYTFRDLTLAPDASVTLFTGCGDDSDTERYWCNQQSAVWNNSGDTVFLRDPNGNNVIAETYAGN